MEGIVVKQLQGILDVMKRDAIAIYLVFQLHLYLVMIIPIIFFIINLNLSFQILDHQCGSAVEMDSIYLQSQYCDESLNNKWCGYDFGDCSSWDTIEGIITAVYIIIIFTTNDYVIIILTNSIICIFFHVFM